MPHSGVGRYKEIGGAELGLVGPRAKRGKIFDLLFSSVKNYALVESRYIKGHAYWLQTRVRCHVEQLGDC